MLKEAVQTMWHAAVKDAWALYIVFSFSLAAAIPSTMSHAASSHLETGEPQGAGTASASRYETWRSSCTPIDVDLMKKAIYEANLQPRQQINYP